MPIRRETPNTPSTILMAIPLAYQDGRDCYTGILEYLATRKSRWNIILIRERLTSPNLKRFLQRGIDGIIFCADMLSDTLIRLVPPHIPCVVMDAVHPEAFGVRAKLAFVDIDSAAIGHMGADHLFTQGNYAAFGIIGYTADCNWSESRVQSFCQTMKRRNRPGFPMLPPPRRRRRKFSPPPGGAPIRRIRALPTGRCPWISPTRKRSGKCLWSP